MLKRKSIASKSALQVTSSVQKADASQMAADATEHGIAAEERMRMIALVERTSSGVRSEEVA